MFFLMIILGSFDTGNTKAYYCTKIRDEKITDWTKWKLVLWPKGTYCILRKGGSCPLGLSVRFFMLGDVFSL